MLIFKKTMSKISQYLVKETKPCDAFNDRENDVSFIIKARRLDSEKFPTVMCIYCLANSDNDSILYTSYPN